MRDKCKNYKNKKCLKWCKKIECSPTTISEFDEKLRMCEIDEVCEKSSIFGNSLFLLTDDDIDALKNGKVLFDVEEYGIFIAYKKVSNGKEKRGIFALTENGKKVRNNDL